MLESIADVFERAALANTQSIITTISISGGVVTYILNSRKEMKLRQAQRFSDMDAAFTDFQKTIIEYTNLDVGWQPLPMAPDLSEDERAKRSVIFEIATSMFEKAFVLYGDAPKKIKEQQWEGWRAYIRGYCAKPEYKKWWFGDHHSEGKSGKQESASYDTKFERFMVGLFKEAA